MRIVGGVGEGDSLRDACIYDEISSPADTQEVSRAPVKGKGSSLVIWSIERSSNTLISDTYVIWLFPTPIIILEIRC